MKQDELDLLVALGKELDEFGKAKIIGKTILMHNNRLNYILNKWIDKGWWECGIGPQSGWFTDEGKRVVKSLDPDSPKTTP
jgi:hypothetical protein